MADLVAPSFNVTHGVESPSSANQPARLVLKGTWGVHELEEFDSLTSALTAALRPLARTASTVVLDDAEVTHLDTAGAGIILDVLLESELAPRFEQLSERHRALFELVSDRLARRPVSTPLSAPKLPFVPSVGRDTLEWIAYLHGGTEFLGRFVGAIGELIRFVITGRRKQIRFREFVVQLEQVFISAIPITSLMAFLIGIVVAYLYASQAIKYGGQIFIIDAVSIAMCRELSPLLVAVIVAGRSGSAFTAQIGTMKLNEEIDALRTLGLSHIHVLVIPRVLALMLTMPLLVFAGDVAGILGGIIIAEGYLDITVTTFLDRLQSVLLLKHVYVGFVKAPVFALFIAMIGCYMGLTTENNARSVGLHTTSTVVQSIVAVILLNAAFAVILVELGI